MKPFSLFRTLFGISIFTFFAHFLSAQAVHFYGSAGKDDACFQMISTADGHRFVAGAVNNDASIYKFDCQGRLVDSVQKDLTLAASFEAFHSLIELPSGEILAVGTAKTLGGLNHVLVARYSAGLDEIAFDTLKINSKTAEGRTVLRSSATGEVFVAGIVAGAGLDFGDIFWQKIDPITLDLIGSATTFSNGIDEISSVSETADGHFLIAGHAVLGNIFDPNALLENRATVRKIKADGSLVWQYADSQTQKNKFGRALFSDALEVAATGQTLAIGQYFGGDTTTNALDLIVRLLSPTGIETASLIDNRLGSQQVWRAKFSATNPSVFVILGDSTRSDLGGKAQFFTSIWAVLNNQLQLLLHQTDATLLGLRPRDFDLKGEEFTAAGLWQKPNSTEIDVFYATNSAFSLAVKPVSNGKLEADPSLAATYSFQWFFQNQPISGATDSLFQPAQNGTFTVVATSATGCTASASYLFSGAANGSVPLFVFVEDTICVANGSLANNVVNDAASYSWTFSDGAMSVEKAPFHFFQTAGTQSAQLCITTKPTQKLAVSIKVLSCGQPNLAEITDLIADPYFILRDATGQLIYRSFSLADKNPPYDLAGTMLLEDGKTYEFSVYDADFIGQDDFLGNVQIANASLGGTFTFGVLSIQFTTVVAAPSYCWTENLIVIPKPPKPTILYNAALERLEAQPQGWKYEYSWFLNGAGWVVGVVPYSPFLNDPAAGNWQVSVVGPHCVAGFSDVTPITVAAREPIWLDGLQLVPNPTDGQISLFFEQKTSENARLELFDAAGQRLENWKIGGATAFSMDLFDRPSGVYSLLFLDEKKVGSRRVVKF